MEKEIERKIELLQELRKKLMKKVQQEDIDYLEKECTYYEIDMIVNNISFLKNKLYILKMPCKEGEIVDIREYELERETKNYMICIHGTTEIVGDISYRGYHVNKKLGDIGYSIIPQYRGNNYAYHALCLLGELLKEQGIDDFWITTEKNNTASKRIIEKYDGIYMGEKEDILCYSCDTKVLKKTI